MKAPAPRGVPVMAVTALAKLPRHLAPLARITVGLTAAAKPAASRSAARAAQSGSAPAG